VGLDCCLTHCVDFKHAQCKQKSDRLHVKDCIRTTATGQLQTAIRTTAT